MSRQCCYSGEFSPSSSASLVAEHFVKALGCDLSDKVFIVTGASSGIGLETAAVLASHNATVILGCRTPKKGLAAQTAVRKSTNNGKVYYIRLDLSSFDSIRKFHKSFLEKKIPLHCLINNAGINVSNSFNQSKDGIEQQFAVNYLGHFYLTRLLEKKLSDSAPSRVINTSSKANEEVERFDVDQLPLEEGNYNPAQAHAISKLAIIMFTRSLSRKWKSKKISAFVVHPGWVVTPYYRDSIATTVKQYLFSWCWKSVEQGAANTIYCALAPGLEGDSGKFFSDFQVSQYLRGAANSKIEGRLWVLSERWAGVNSSGESYGVDIKVEGELDPAEPIQSTVSAFPEMTCTAGSVSSELLTEETISDESEVEEVWYKDRYKITETLFIRSRDGSVIQKIHIGEDMDSATGVQEKSVFIVLSMSPEIHEKQLKMLYTAGHDIAPKIVTLYSSENCAVLQRGSCTLQEYAMRGAINNLAATFHDIASLLLKLKEKHIVVGDLQPDRIWWYPHEYVWKLINFPSVQEEGSAMSGSSLNPCYGAPELVCESDSVPADFSMDMWSLGMIFNFCIEGKPLWSKKDLALHDLRQFIKGQTLPLKRKGSPERLLIPEMLQLDARRRTPIEALVHSAVLNSRTEIRQALDNVMGKLDDIQDDVKDVQERVIAMNDDLVQIGLRFISTLPTTYPRFFILDIDQPSVIERKSFFKNLKYNIGKKIQTPWIVHLICEGNPHMGSDERAHPCVDQHEGYCTKLTREWLIKSLPVIRTLLRVMILAVAVGSQGCVNLAPVMDALPNVGKETILAEQLDSDAFSEKLDSLSENLAEMEAVASDGKPGELPHDQEDLRDYIKDSQKLLQYLLKDHMEDGLPATGCLTMMWDPIYHRHTWVCEHHTEGLQEKTKSELPPVSSSSEHPRIPKTSTPKPRRTPLEDPPHRERSQTSPPPSLQSFHRADSQSRLQGTRRRSEIDNTSALHSPHGKHSKRSVNRLPPPEFKSPRTYQSTRELAQSPSARSDSRTPRSDSRTPKTAETPSITKNAGDYSSDRSSHRKSDYSSDRSSHRKKPKLKSILFKATILHGKNISNKHQGNKLSVYMSIVDLCGQLHDSKSTDFIKADPKSGGLKTPEWNTEFGWTVKGGVQMLNLKLYSKKKIGTGGTLIGTAELPMKLRHKDEPHSVEVPLTYGKKGRTEIGSVQVNFILKSKT